MLIGCTSFFASNVSAQLGSLIVTVTSPTAGSQVGGTTTISASVTIVGALTVGGVQFQVDGVNVGAEDTTVPYSTPWNTIPLSNGSHTLTAVGRSLLGLRFTSDPVTVTVFNDKTAPTVSLTAPANGATISGTTTVTATASDNVGVVGVQFKLDGVNLGAEDATAPYSMSWNSKTASNASHTLTAVARDAAGNATTATVVTVTVFNDTTPPAVSLSAPASGATVSGTTTVSATASDDVGVAGVQFKLDGANLGAEDVSAPYSVSWNTKTASNASHTLTAVARDAAGNATTATVITVTVFNDTTPPAVNLTAPANGATVSGTTTVSATASDNVGVAGVQFKLDGANLGAEDVTAPYSVSWNTKTASNASHTLTAVARDAAGNATTAATVTVTVFNDTTAPTVSLTAPANGETVSGTTTITATASDDVGVAGVQFKLDGANFGAEVTTAPYSIPWDTKATSNASHTLAAVARDAAGNATTAATITVTVANNTGSTIRIEETTTAVRFLKVWTQNFAGAPGGWSGGSIAFSVEAAARATVTFTGTGASWVGWRGPQQGIANVYVDGALVGSVDAYAASTAVQAVLYSTPTLALGTHTLAIEVTRTRNAASSDYYVAVDAFDVAGAPPDTTPPSVAISAPVAGAMVSGTATVRADASDDVAVVGVQFLVDGVPLANDTAVPYAINWDTTTVPDGSHSLTAVARDGAGNTTSSAAVAVTVSNSASPPSATRFEETDLSIGYTPGTLGPGQPPDWFLGSRSRGWSQGTASFNRSAGARATFTFSGTGVSWIGFRAPWAGIANVYVDGALVTQLDLYATTELVQTPVFSATNLTPGTHTLTVESTGQKNADASDYAVVVDAFDVTPGSPPTIVGTRIEETSSSAAFTSGWTQGDATKAWSAGAAVVSSTPAVPGARVTFTFTGTSVNWIGSCGPQNGIARVYLDGAFQATVDTYSPTPFQAVVYTVTKLAPATHTLAIEVTGQRNASATDSLIYVDAIDVQSRIEDDDPAIAYSGSWLADVGGHWSGGSLETGGGTAMRSATAGSHAEFTFAGTSVTWIGFRASWLGMADVSVDGGAPTRIDLYSPTDSVQVAVFRASGLTPGTHILRIVIAGEKNPASTAAWVMVDAFDVALLQPAPSVTRLQENDPSVTFTADWAQPGTSNLWSGEQAKQSTTVGGRATVTFRGTSVRWIGERGFGTGLANVSIDGQFVALIDTSTTVQEGYQAILFSATGLTLGTHTLTIDVVGRNNEAPGTTVQRLIVDAFDVY